MDDLSIGSADSEAPAARRPPASATPVGAPAPASASKGKAGKRAAGSPNAPAPAPVRAPTAKRTAGKREAGPPKRLSLEVAGAASHWATPRAAAAPPAPTPMTNEMSTMLDGQELEVGDEIEALGSAPGGSRAWFRAKVVALRSRYPPIHIKFTATLEGVTHRLALPEPVTAYVNADGVRRIAG